MSICTRTSVRCLWGLMAGVVLVWGAYAIAQPAEEDPSSTAPASQPMVEGEVAVHALMALSDHHLQKIADVYSILATMDSVRSAQWEQVREPLANAARVNVPALYWFALPDGSYWTLDQGRAQASLADRAYFPRVLEGEKVIGDLVTSRATGKSSAIVAVPVYEGDTVVGVLGASVYLDSLSEQISEEMNLGPDYIFYSLDQTPIIGLNTDPQIIFMHPLEEGGPELANVAREILSHDQGVVTYRFKGEPRTVHYQKSPVTGWWYGFGKVHR